MFRLPITDVDVYYNDDTLFRDLPPQSQEQIGVRLMLAEPLPGHDWKTVADCLGFQPTDIDTFAAIERSRPACSMLQTWSRRNGSNLLVLRRVLSDMNRKDVVSLLDEVCQRKCDIYLSLTRQHDSQSSNPTVNVTGRRSLCVAVSAVLRDYVCNQRILLPVAFYLQYEDQSLTWASEVHQFMGQIVNVRVEQNAELRHGDGQRVDNDLYLVDDTKLVLVANLDASRTVARSFNAVQETTHGSFASVDLDLRSTAENQATGLDRQEGNDLSNELTAMKLQNPDDDDATVAAYTRELEIKQEVEFLRGYHPHLNNACVAIKRAMQLHRDLDGAYIIRTFYDDKSPSPRHMKLAIAVMYQRQLKHFLINELQDINNRRRFYLFSNDLDFLTVQELIRHYERHPLMPRQGADNLSPSGLKLSRPVPRAVETAAHAQPR